MRVATSPQITHWDPAEWGGGAQCVLCCVLCLFGGCPPLLLAFLTCGCVLLLAPPNLITFSWSLSNKTCSLDLLNTFNSNRTDKIRTTHIRTALCFYRLLQQFLNKYTIITFPSTSALSNITNYFIKYVRESEDQRELDTLSHHLQSGMGIQDHK